MALTSAEGIAVVEFNNVQAAFNNLKTAQRSNPIFAGLRIRYSPTNPTQEVWIEKDNEDVA